MTSTNRLLRSAALAVVVGLGVLAAWALLADGRGGHGRGGDGAAPEPTATAASGPVALPVGEDLAAIMAAHQAGTTFVLQSGTHHGQWLVPDDGDTILAEEGGVLDGTLALDGAAFAAEGDVWVAGEREEIPVVHGALDPGFERDAHTHDLWAGDQRLQHVPSRDEVDAPGEWFFDYDADEVVLFDEPRNDRPLALAVTPHAFRSTAEGVTIRGVTVQRYASPAQFAALWAEGPDWLVEDVVVRDNHGAGVRLGDRGTLRASTVVDNGQVGVTADVAVDVLVEDNEIARNGLLGFDWTWESGGTKFKYTEGLVVRGNHVHSNRGIGVWVDLDNVDSLIADNVVEDNEVMGIFLEVSEEIDATGNTVTGNGFGPRAGLLGAGMSVSGAADVRITGNTLAGNAAELTVIHYARDRPDGGSYAVDDVVVSDNAVEVSTEGSVGFYVDTDEDELYSDGSVRFEGNAYVVDGCDLCFRWDGLIDADGWVAVGNDVEGTFTDAG